MPTTFASCAPERDTRAEPLFRFASLWRAYRACRKGKHRSASAQRYALNLFDGLLATVAALQDRHTAWVAEAGVLPHGGRRRALRRLVLIHPLTPNPSPAGGEGSSLPKTPRPLRERGAEGGERGEVMDNLLKDKGMLS